MPSPELSVIVPVYDEGPALPDRLDVLAAALRAVGRTSEILVVDDGSRDGGGARIAAWAAAEPARRVLTLAENRGKGAAVATGMLAARGAVRVFMDADLSTDLDALPRALAALDDGADVVFATRRGAGARVDQHQSALRERLGVGFSWLVRHLVDPRVDDCTCGFKACTAPAATAVFSRVRVTRWAFDAEVAAIVRAQQLALVMLPVRWTDQPASRVQVAGAVVRSTIDLTRILWRRASGAYTR